MDPELVEFPEEEVMRYAKVAFFCTQAAASRRPLMSQVVDMLSRNIRLNEKELTAPGYFQTSDDCSRKPSSTDSASYQMSSVPVTITEVTPRWRMESITYLKTSLGGWSLCFNFRKMKLKLLPGQDGICCFRRNPLVYKNIFFSFIVKILFLFL